jgi:hypothetical protein
VTFSIFIPTQVKVVLRADVSSSTYDKVAIISGLRLQNFEHCFHLLLELSFFDK